MQYSPHSIYFGNILRFNWVVIATSRYYSRPTLPYPSLVCSTVRCTFKQPFFICRIMSIGSYVHKCDRIFVFQMIFFFQKSNKDKRIVRSSVASNKPRISILSISVISSKTYFNHIISILSAKFSSIFWFPQMRIVHFYLQHDELITHFQCLTWILSPIFMTRIKHWFTYLVCFAFTLPVNIIIDWKFEEHGNKMAERSALWLDTMSWAVTFHTYRISLALYTLFFQYMYIYSHTTHTCGARAHPFSHRKFSQPFISNARSRTLIYAQTNEGNECEGVTVLHVSIYFCRASFARISEVKRSDAYNIWERESLWPCHSMCDDGFWFYCC